MQKDHELFFLFVDKMSDDKTLPELKLEPGSHSNSVYLYPYRVTSSTAAGRLGRVTSDTAA